MKTQQAALSKLPYLFALAALTFAVLAPAQTPPPPTPAQIAPTPPMGWNSWNRFAGKVTDADVRAAADAMVSSGMKDAGYQYINIDDTWEGERDAAGNIQSNSKFPNMKALADYIHSKGLKFGIYSGPGPTTCAGYAASYNHEQQDANTWAAWGVDYLKYDLCSFTKAILKPAAGDDQQKALAMIEQAYTKMHQSLVNTGRPIVFSVCYSEYSPWRWAPVAGGNLWRTTNDIQPSYESMALIGFEQAGLSKFAGPGHWNDPDMLEIGNGKLNPDEARTHFSLWAILAAPLLAGNDLSTMDDATKSILTNKEVIAIDQDPLGIEGDRVHAEGTLEVWAKPLHGGAVAVAFFNRSSVESPISVDFKDLNVLGPVHARDLWTHTDLGVLKGSYTAKVPRHGVVLLRLNP